MPYIKRVGVTFSGQRTLLTLALIVTLVIQSDWENQFTTLPTFLKFTIYNEVVTILLFFLIFAILVTYVWFYISRVMGPTVGVFIARLYGSVTSKPFIDRKIKDKRMGLALYSQRYFNLVLLLFSLDFLFSNTIFASEAELSNLSGMLLGLAFISLIDPMIYTLNDIGLRLWNEATAEIISVTSILDRFILRTLQTSSLIASLVVISLDKDIINSIPVQIRVIFVRDFLLASFLIYIFSTFFQGEPVIKAWKMKSIPQGRVSIAFTKV